MGGDTGIRAERGVRLTAAAAATVLALGLAGGGVAHADSGAGSAGLIHACVTRSGLVRIAPRCSAGEPAVGLMALGSDALTSARLAKATKKKKAPARGPRGFTGPAGKTGATGPAGTAGPAGPAGSTGPAGAMGQGGAAGVNGATGPQGATGGQGVTGASAPAYTAGTGLSLSGTAFSLSPTFVTSITTACASGDAITQLSASAAPACSPFAAPGPPTGTAGGALAGSYPDPTLNVTGGDNGATACASGEAATALSTQAVLQCGPGVFRNLSSLNYSVGGFTSNPAQGDNSAFGGAALEDTTGADNSAFGASALVSPTGSDNTGVGADALTENLAGAGNTAVGYQALLGNGNGNDNTAIGELTTPGPSGSDNILIGDKSGFAYSGAESSNVDIANQGTVGESHVIHIGTQGTGAGDQSAIFVAGASGTAIAGPDSPVLVNSNGQLGTSTTSLRADKQDITALSRLVGRVLALHPVSYRYKRKYAAKVNPTQYGLLAGQVARVLPALDSYGSNGKPTGVYYQELGPLLLAVVDRQQHQIAALRSLLRRLEAEISRRS